jgi:hypothetical protein
MFNITFITVFPKETLGTGPKEGGSASEIHCHGRREKEKKEKKILLRCAVDAHYVCSDYHY